MEAKESNNGEGGLVVAIALSGGAKSKALIKWALEKFLGQGKVSFKLLHVHPRITSVPTPMGNLIPLQQVRDDIAAAYRKEVEWQKMEMILPYQKLCTFKKVPAEIVLVEADEIATALSQEIAKIGAKEAVIGASSNGLFSRKVKGQMLSSLISECAPHACTVYVVSKGKLESLRPSDDPIASRVDDTTSVSSSSPYTSTRYSSSTLGTGSVSSEQPLASPYHSMTRMDQTKSAMMPFTEAMRESSDINRWKSMDLNNNGNVFSYVAGKSMISQGSSTTMYTTENDSFVSEKSSSSSFSSPSTTLNSSQTPTRMDMELDMLRMELRHIRGMYTRAQHETVNASQKLNSLSKLRLEEAAHLQDINTKEEEAKDLAKLEAKKAEAAKEEADYAKESAFREAYKRKEAELTALRAAREKESLKNIFSGPNQQFQQFSWDDIESGCSSFAEEFKIGIGAFGTVYKCKINHTNMAAKVLHSNEGSESKQFLQELDVLSRIRHPHLLQLLGACPEKGCLVYEFMEKGSLEDRLFCKDNTSPIKWYDRFRIAWEVASALAFLHNTKPKPIIHRDLKPANILLDQNLVSKIGDAGLCTMLNVDPASSMSTLNAKTLYKNTTPAGTLSYIDPEYQRTGQLSAKSDTYALGMVILQLLTAKPAVGITYIVEDALSDDCLMQIVDQSAGEWPVKETAELAELGVQCSELRRKDRPDLKDKVLPLLERLKEFADQAKDVAVNGPVAPPSHFLCPMLKDIMEEPCVAADGYTYDRKAIEMWLKDNDTSPTTNFPLSSKELIPNYTLHYAITEWKTKRKPSSRN